MMKYISESLLVRDAKNGRLLSYDKDWLKSSANLAII